MTTHRCDCDYCGYGDALADTLQRESVLTNEWMQRALKAERERDAEKAAHSKALDDAFWLLNHEEERRMEAERTAAALQGKLDTLRWLIQDDAYARTFRTTQTYRISLLDHPALAPTKEEA